MYSSNVRRKLFEEKMSEKKWLENNVSVMFLLLYETKYITADCQLILLMCSFGCIVEQN
jgi:hypothetical protein